MTTEQVVTLTIRLAAALVWLAYLVRTMRGDLHVETAVVAVLIALYAGAQAIRALTAPASTFLEFTLISAVALVAGLALLTSPRR